MQELGVAERPAQPRRAKTARLAAARTPGVGWRALFAFRAPRRGSEKVAQGKAAEAAALGKEPPRPTSFFPSGVARQRRATPEGKKEGIILRH
jgi:hypothetical protein